MFSRLRVVVAGGIFSAIAAVVLSAVLTILFIVPSGARANLKEIASEFFVLCLFATIPAGFFGFLAGLVGSAWLSLRAGRVRSMVHLVGESAVVGGVLSLSFPAFHRVMGWAGQRANYAFEAKELIFSLCVGVPCAVLFALIFGRLLLPKKSASTMGTARFAARPGE